MTLAKALWKSLDRVVPGRQSGHLPRRHCAGRDGGLVRLDSKPLGGIAMKKSLLLGVALAAFAFSAPALAADLKFKPGEDKRFHWENFDELKKVDLKGETLTIFGPWRGEDEDLARSVLDYFAEATGAEIKYSSSENYEQQIVIDTQAGSPPNI